MAAIAAPESRATALMKTTGLYGLCWYTMPATAVAMSAARPRTLLSSRITG